MLCQYLPRFIDYQKVLYRSSTSQNLNNNNSMYIRVSAANIVIF